MATIEKLRASATPRMLADTHRQHHTTRPCRNDKFCIVTMTSVVKTDTEMSAVPGCAPSSGDAVEGVLRNPDILRLLFSQLEMPDLIRVGATCRQWYNVAESDEFWRTLDFQNKNIRQEEVRVSLRLDLVMRVTLQSQDAEDCLHVHTQSEFVRGRVRCPESMSLLEGTNIVHNAASSLWGLSGVSHSWGTCGNSPLSIAAPDLGRAEYCNRMQVFPNQDSFLSRLCERSCWASYEGTRIYCRSTSRAFIRQHAHSWRCSSVSKGILLPSSCSFPEHLLP